MLLRYKSTLRKGGGPSPQESLMYFPRRSYILGKYIKKGGGSGPSTSLMYFSRKFYIGMPRGWLPGYLPGREALRQAGWSLKDHCHQQEHHPWAALRQWNHHYAKCGHG